MQNSIDFDYVIIRLVRIFLILTEFAIPKNFSLITDSSYRHIIK